MTNSITQSPLHTYRRYLEEGVLAYQYSPAAGRAVFYPRVICPYTGSDALEWRVSGGYGVIHAITEIAPKNGESYHVALIDMDEGFRLMSNVLPSSGCSPAIGMRVRAEIVRLGDDKLPNPVFRVEDDHDA